MIEYVHFSRYVIYNHFVLLSECFTICNLQETCR
jgi:hypothetical protein